MRQKSTYFFITFWLYTISSCAISGAQEVKPDIEKLMACSALADDTARRRCFEDNNAESTTDTATATTSEIIKPADPLEYQIVDPDDIMVSPGKFRGKPLELKSVQCFYADKDEYRCLANSSSVVMVTAPEITPTEAKATLENACGQIKKITSKECRRRIRFTAQYIEEDEVNAMVKRSVVVTKKIEILPPEATSRKKRR